MKKKIIISTYDDVHNPYYAGGGAYSIKELTERLASDYDITVITGNYPKAKDTKEHGIVYKRIGPKSGGPKLGQILFHLFLPFYVMKETYDLWIESFTPPFSTSCLQLYTKKPVIGLVHMLASEDMERKYKLPFHVLENQGLKTYQHFIVLTDTFRKKIARVNKKASMFLIPNGVNLTPFHKSAQQKEEYILSLGRLEFDQKGLDLLIDGFNSIAHKTKAKLIIAGSGLEHDESLIKAKIIQYGLENRIVLPGRVVGKQKESLLRDCSFVVMPSRFETFGMVALEAMSYGKPMISFAIDGFAWIPKDCILKVRSFDTKALGSNINRLLHDKPLRDRMSRAALNEIKKYSWDTIAIQYKEAINKVI